MKCEVCGKTTHNDYYKLCWECYDLKEEGKIVICNYCGIYHKTDEPCRCNKQGNPKTLCKRCGNEIKEGYFCDYCKNYYEWNGNVFCNKCNDYHSQNYDCVNKEFVSVHNASFKHIEIKTYTCENCGKDSESTPLCPECKTLQDNGELDKCEYCNKWHSPKYVCSELRDYFINTIAKQYWQLKTANKNNENLLKMLAEAEKKGSERNTEIQCITGCGNVTNDGYYFCTSCWKKYKDKTILLDIKKCTEFNVWDSFYGGTQRANDGHIVKSDGEEKIDNALYDLGIAHAYEQELEIDGLDEPLKPDFYISEYKAKCGTIRNIYIEFWGREDDPNYEKQKAFKMGHYQEELANGKDYTFLYIYPKDLRRISGSAKSIIKKSLDKLNRNKENSID